MAKNYSPPPKKNIPKKTPTPTHAGPPREFWALGQKETPPRPPILQIMILELSPPGCVISKESVGPTVNKNELMNCDLENSFLLVYLSGFMFFLQVSS